MLPVSTQVAETHRGLRRAFLAFHLTLGLGLFYGSARTVVLALRTAETANPHLVLLGGVEAFGALLFLVPRTITAGASLLLLTIGIATMAHAAQLQLRADLLVYAAGVVLVMIHGPAYRPR